MGDAARFWPCWDPEEFAVDFSFLDEPAELLVRSMIGREEGFAPESADPPSPSLRRWSRLPSLEGRHLDSLSAFDLLRLRESFPLSAADVFASPGLSELRSRRSSEREPEWRSDRPLGLSLRSSGCRLEDFLTWDGSLALLRLGDERSLE